MKYDLVIVGGGIVGAAAAWQFLQRYPDRSVLLLEKESGCARHQTGHNSGVIHAGVYYSPGSLKARFCREGSRETLAFCHQFGLAADQPGKLLVATGTAERQGLIDLQNRCRQNEIAAHWLEADELHQIEPNISGIAALQIPASGIVDFPAVTEKLLQLFAEAGGELRYNFEVETIGETADGVELAGTGETVTGKYLLCCAGLMADKLVAMMGVDPDFRIIPFRGEYYQLPAIRKNWVRHLIYPVPDPKLPFLGVHLTPMIGGGITLGPNAVLGWKREGYGRLNFNLADSLNMLAYPGFWRLSQQNWRAAIVELKNAWSKKAYLRQVRKYCPTLTLDDMLPYPAGIRAQAVFANGQMVSDFHFVQTRRSLHIGNAPSPAATSALPIGRHLVSKMADWF